jgi:hypothetical protein
MQSGHGRCIVESGKSDLDIGHGVYRKEKNNAPGPKAFGAKPDIVAASVIFKA